MIRGPAVTAGYGADDPVNAAAFAHGWFHTGDQGVLDEDGYLTISGRLKEIINRGGEKISPREVEEVLLAHPGVAQAVVVRGSASDDGRGRRGGDRGRRQRQTLDAEELRDFVAARLTAHKVPQRIAFRDELPLGPTGKLQRIGMAERLGMLDAPAPDGPRRQRGSSMSPLERALAGSVGGAARSWIASVATIASSTWEATRSLPSLSSPRSRETFGVELPVTAPLVEAPTVAAMAAMITEHRAPSDESTGREISTRTSSTKGLVDRAGGHVVRREDEPGSLCAPHPGRPAIARTAGRRRAGAEPHRIGTAPRGPADAVSSKTSTGLPRAVVDATDRLRAAHRGVSEVPETDRVAAARAGRQIGSLGRFRLDEGPLFRARLVRFAPDDHVLSLVDPPPGRPMAGRAARFATSSPCCIRAEREGVAADLRLPSARFAEFASCQQRRIATAAR